jgi:hypothetical protein
MTKTLRGLIVGLWAGLCVLLPFAALAQDRLVPGHVPAQVGSTLAVTCVDPTTGAANSCSSPTGTDAVGAAPTVNPQVIGGVGGNSGTVTRLKTCDDGYLCVVVVDTSRNELTYTGATQVQALDSGGGDATNTTLHANNSATPLYPTTDLTSAVVSFASSGDNTLVSATSSQTTKVYRLVAVSACAQNITVKSASTARTGAIPVSANTGLVLDFSTRPWFTTGTNEAFILNGSVACQVSGWIEYVKN